MNGELAVLCMKAWWLSSRLWGKALSGSQQLLLMTGDFFVLRLTVYSIIKLYNALPCKVTNAWQNWVGVDNW